MSKSYRSDNSQERLLRLVFKTVSRLSHFRKPYKLLSFENLQSDNYVKCSVPGHKRNDFTKTVSGK